MKNKMTKLPPIGSTLKCRDGGTRKVVGHFPAIPGGFYLNQPYKGFRSWNIDSGEFELIKPKLIALT